MCMFIWNHLREIMLFVGKPIGRSWMMSNHLTILIFELSWPTQSLTMSMFQAYCVTIFPNRLMTGPCGVTRCLIGTSSLTILYLSNFLYIYIYIYVYFRKTQQWFVSYRGPPYNFRWKVLACLFAQVYHEVWRHGNKLKRKTVDWQFTRPHALCIALRPTSYVENNCIIQNHHISDSSNPFSVCSCRRTLLFEAAHFCRPIILQHICCCVKPVVIPCVKDTTRLHVIHGSVNVLCFCGSHSSVLMLMGVRCQRPCDVWIFRLCLFKRQWVESLLFHLTHIWRVPHPRNGPNLATYIPVYTSRRYQLPLTLLLRFKAILTLKTFLYFDHFVLEFIDYQETEDPEAINWIATFDLRHIEVDRVASLYNVKQKDMWPPMQCSAMVDKFWQQKVPLVEWLFSSPQKVWVRGEVKIAFIITH